VLDLDFVRALATCVRARRPDAFLVGEVVHGDYARWANPGMLDSVTNYEDHGGWRPIEGGRLRTVVPPAWAQVFQIAQ